MTLQDLFRGLPRAYGTYRVTEQVAKGKKAEGKASTIQGPITAELWQKHISGERSLGIVPVTDDAICYFGAIDIDIYDINFHELAAAVIKHDLPLNICATKSGGAHLYVFIPAGQPAVDVRIILSQYASILGYPGAEVFPKQDSLAGPEDVGNWINMPYFGDTRKAFAQGKWLTLNQFLSNVITVDQLQPLEVAESLQGAPPCLITLANRGVPEGSRNDGLFNFAVLACKKEDANLVYHYNEQYIRPPLPHSEVSSIAKSVMRKDYFYKCKQNPINAVCNKGLCKKAKYGLGSDQQPGINIEALDKICSQPPTWIVQISGKRVRIDTDELVSQTKFAKKCLEEVNYMPPIVKASVWTEMVNRLMLSVREIEAPIDAGQEGQFLHHLEQFCTTKAPANSIDELLLGKPWHHEGRTYFRSADLLRYLDQQHFREYKGNQIYAVMRQHIESIQHHGSSLKGKFVNYWSIPSFEQQDEEFDVQRVDKEEF